MYGPCLLALKMLIRRFGVFALTDLFCFPGPFRYLGNKGDGVDAGFMLPPSGIENYNHDLTLETEFQHSTVPTSIFHILWHE